MCATSKLQAKLLRMAAALKQAKRPSRATAPAPTSSTLRVSRREPGDPLPHLTTHRTSSAASRTSGQPLDERVQLAIMGLISHGVSANKCGTVLACMLTSLNIASLGLAPTHGQRRRAAQMCGPLTVIVAALHACQSGKPARQLQWDGTTKTLHAGTIWVSDGRGVTTCDALEAVGTRCCAAIDILLCRGIVTEEQAACGKSCFCHEATLVVMTDHAPNGVSAARRS